MSLQEQSETEPRARRRTFLKKIGEGVSAATTCSLAGLLAGCTLPVRSFRTKSAPVVEIPVADYPELERKGGLVKVVLQQSGAVFVRCNGGDAYEGISAICTHMGCVVEPSQSGFRCPCHGSVYNSDGQNVSGPAPRPLSKLRAERQGETIRLYFTSAGS
jgi:Rieske Fe-S protein